MFNALCRKMMQPSRLGKQDEHGLSLLHYAAMNNHPQIIAQLLIQSMDVNVRRNNIMGTGEYSRIGSDVIFPCSTPLSRKFKQLINIQTARNN